MIQRLLKKNVSMRNAIVLQQQIVSSKQQMLCHSRQKYVWIHWSWLFFCICFAVFWIEKSADSSDAMNEQNDPFLLYCNLEHADVRIFSGQKKNFWSLHYNCLLKEKKKLFDHLGQEIFNTKTWIAFSRKCCRSYSEHVSTNDPG